MFVFNIIFKINWCKVHLVRSFSITFFRTVWLKGMYFVVILKWVEEYGAINSVLVHVFHLWNWIRTWTISRLIWSRRGSITVTVNAFSRIDRVVSPRIRLCHKRLLHDLLNNSSAKSKVKCSMEMYKFVNSLCTSCIYLQCVYSVGVKFRTLLLSTDVLMQLIC